jgi:DNA adenine methylase
MTKPFAKCAGGKGRMLKYIADGLSGKYDRYYEPFVGGGSVFFEMAKLGRFKQATLGDSNADLMTTYIVIRNYIDKLITLMQDKTKDYTYSKKRYLEIRDQDPAQMDPIERAARFLYLNKCCFNGLYRVNKSGRFNVPFGKYENPVICDEKNLREVHEILKDVYLMCCDFEQVLDGAKKGDAVYLDPPYLPLSATSKFTQYSGKGFTEADHWRLRGVFGGLVGIGVRTVLSNSSAPLAHKLYEDFHVINLKGLRSVGGPASYRKPVKEILVIGEKPPKKKKRK